MTTAALVFFLSFANVAQEREYALTLANLQGNWELVEQKPNEGELTLAMMRARGAPTDAIEEMQAHIAKGELATRKITMLIAGDTMTVQGRLDEKDGPPTTSRFSLNSNRITFQAKLPGGLMRLGRSTLLFAADPFPQLGLPAVRYLYRRQANASPAAPRGVLDAEERVPFLEAHIAQFAAMEFPEHRGQWLIEAFRNVEAETYVIATPDPPSVGFERLLFVVSFAKTLPTRAVASYGWQDQRFVLLTTTPGVSPSAYPATMTAP